MFKVSAAVIIFLILQLICFSKSVYKIYPEQVHISLGDHPQELIVTWITFRETKDTIVWYGTLNQGFLLRTEGCSVPFVDEGKEHVVRYIHRVVLSALQPENFYVYRCGSSLGLSEAFIFKTSPLGSDWSPRLIVYGDMGWKGAATLPCITREARKFTVDAIVHVGDIGYNLDSCNGRVGDEFLKMMQPIASSIPYMTVPGNHEQAYNFSHYKNLFSMPGNSEGLFYSFDLGPAHFVIISTEVYYFTQYGSEPLTNQFAWLQEDLMKASNEKNRILRPWIIVFGHRPMYCSSDSKEDCSLLNNVLKTCIFDSNDYSLETLFQNFRVDVYFAGHMHYYERSWPIYDNEVRNGSCEEPYTNAGAAVHIITGAASFRLVWVRKTNHFRQSHINTEMEANPCQAFKELFDTHNQPWLTIQEHLQQIGKIRRTVVWWGIHGVVYFLKCWNPEKL